MEELLSWRLKESCHYCCFGKIGGLVAHGGNGRPTGHPGGSVGHGGGGGPT